MLDIGLQELLVVMVLALLVFGPDKLPDLGRRLGRAIREFRRASDEFRSTIETNLSLAEEPPLPPSAAPTPGTTPDEAPSSSVPVAADGAVVAAADAHAFDAPGAGPAAEPAAAASGLAMAVEPFCAQRGGRLLHRVTCGWAARIPDTERIALKTAAEGWELGLTACPVCGPAEGEPAS